MWTNLVAYHFQKKQILSQSANTSCKCDQKQYRTNHQQHNGRIGAQVVNPEWMFLLEYPYPNTDEDYWEDPSYDIDGKDQQTNEKVDLVFRVCDEFS